MLNVREAIVSIMKVEGGYVNHPHDKGGPTNYGITEKVARAYGYQGKMEDLPDTLAFDIYIQRYWIDPKFDQIAVHSALIAQEMLDTGINMGQATAVKFLQRALNTLNRQGSSYPDVKVDGVLGTITLFCLKTFLRERGSKGEQVLFRMLNAQQSVRYMEIAEANQKQESFQYGWQKERVV